MKEAAIEIYVHPIFGKEEQAYFTTKLPKNITVFFNNGTNDFNLAKNSNLAIGNFNTEWIDNMPNLTTILLDSVGIDNFNNYQWTKDTVSVYNLQYFFSIPVAEEVIANILNIYRKLPKLQSVKKEKSWIKDSVRFQKRILNEAKVILFGYGSIGKQIHTLLTAFGTEVTLCDYRQRKEQKQLLMNLVQTHDILIVTVPATTETIDIIDNDILSHTKKGFVLINVGRGQVINEDDLIKKAKTDPTFTACLDVTKTEPIPFNSPLWDCENIYLTQHTGGGTETENLKKIDVYLKQINSLIHNKELENKVIF